jgi:hypothetical protein
MTRKQDSAKRENWKDLVAGQEDFLKSLVQEVVQQVLEQEMEETPAGRQGRADGGAAGVSVGLLSARSGDPSGQTGAPRATRPARAVSHGDLRTVSAQ